MDRSRAGDTVVQAVGGQIDSKGRKVMLQIAGNRQCWRQKAMPWQQGVLQAEGDAACSRQCCMQQAQMASGCFCTLSKRLKKTGHKCVNKNFYNYFL